MNSSQVEINLKNLINTFDKETFIYELLVAYGISRTTVTRLKKGDFNLSKVPGEVLYKKKVLFKEALSGSLLTTIDQITKNEEALKHNPRFVIVTDFSTLLAKDTRTGLTLDIPILEIDKHYHFFLPWANSEIYKSKNDTTADRNASYEMAKLYDILVHENPNIYDDGGHNLNIFLSRILFCFFAEDTNIFPVEGMFTDTLVQHTNTNGNDVDVFLDRLFLKLNTEFDKDAPAFLEAFPYVNGGLFNDTIKSPKFSAKARKIILDCGNLNWSEINPDIFGSMIQAVVNPEYRSGLGMHYTSVPNIMKVIEPLFLNELKEEFEKSKGNSKKLRQLIHRISKIKIFDPACGSGNFLIIAYKELRRLEIEIIKEINDFGQTPIIDGSQSKIHFTPNGHKIVSNAPQARMNFGGQIQIWFTEIKLSQFYGIELDDFAHEMAILALWLAEHQMNKVFVDELHDFGKAKPILPLKEAGHITQGNATRIDWNIACPKHKNDEIYILGNPPYLGSSMQDSEQKKDMAIVFNGFKNYKNLDYIAAWFKKGTDYISNFNASFSFVSTNSICQGEQVALIWPYIFNKHLEISFAYTSFKWTNNAKGNAGVTVIIVGLSNISDKQKIIFLNGLKKDVSKINAYLIEGSNVIFARNNKSISGFPELVRGSMPTDGGHFTLDRIQRDELLKNHPESSIIIRKYLSGGDFLNGKERYCLWIPDNLLDFANNIPFVKKRLDLIREFRLLSDAPTTVEYAEFPNRFRQISYSDTDCVVLPLTSSIRRNYIPFDFSNGDTVVTNSAAVIYNAEFWHFGVITSKMHMVWVSIVAGRLKTDYRYSSFLCYNNFPFPIISAKQKETINLHVFAILEEREKHSGKTLAQLYDPDKMPKGLKDAHHELDLAIERCYRPHKPFESDSERLEYLFKMYEEMISKNSLFQKEKKTKKVK